MSISGVFIKTVTCVFSHSILRTFSFTYVGSLIRLLDVPVRQRNNLT